MECAAKQAASARAIQALLRPRHNVRYILTRRLQPSASIQAHSQSIRHASSTSQPPPPSKPIVLEKPDKFRPPSHAARRNARSTTSMYGAGAAYNQGMTERERAASQKKQYPHMFPNEGTTMHWFLTTKWVHVTLTLVGLQS